VITSIEGAWKPELQVRCVEVAYEIKGKKIGRDDIEDEIVTRRDEMLSAMVHVLRVFMQHRSSGERKFWAECPLPNFERHLSVLAELLYAYARVAKKPETWAEKIIGTWVTEISHADADAEDELESPLRQIFNTIPLPPEIDAVKVQHKAKSGTLYVTETGFLLSLLQKRSTQETAIPRNATGLSRRLRSAKFRAIQFLDEESAPGLPQLRRTAKKRPIGFFLTDDVVTANDLARSLSAIAANSGPSST
jgi:hypothetical protein